MSLDAHIDRYLDYLVQEKAYSEHTVNAYANDLGQFSDFVEKEQLEWPEITQKDLNHFLADRAESISKRSKARKVSALKSFYRFMYNREMIESSTFSTWRAPKFRKSLPKPVRRLDLEKLLEEEDNRPPALQLRDKALWEMMYSAGARISELLALNLQDLISDGKVAEYVTVRGKGSKERQVFLGNKAREVLNAYLEVRRDILRQNSRAEQRALFVNARGGRLGRRGAGYLLRRRRLLLQMNREFTVHSLRHSFATDLIDSGCDIRHVQEMLGHASISTTQNYVQVAKERLMQTFWKAHPHARRD